jgi:hypothetical protein
MLPVSFFAVYWIKNLPKGEVSKIWGMIWNSSKKAIIQSAEQQKRPAQGLV